MGDDSDEQLEQRVDQLEQQLSKMLPNRRGVLKGLGAAAIGGAAVGGATGGAAGQSAAGQIGTPDDRVDVFANNYDVAGDTVFDSVNTDEERVTDTAVQNKAVIGGAELNQRRSYGSLPTTWTEEADLYTDSDFNDHVTFACIVDAEEIFSSPEANYYLYYSGYRTNDIRLLVSDSLTDGWSKSVDSPLFDASLDAALDTDIDSPWPLYDPVAGEMHIYAHSTTGAGGPEQFTFRASSSDGKTNWSYDGKVLSLPTNGVWDADQRAYMTVYADGKSLYGYYHGRNNFANHLSIGYAWSPDGSVDNWRTLERPLSGGDGVNFTSGGLNFARATEININGQTHFIVRDDGNDDMKVGPYLGFDSTDPDAFESTNLPESDIAAPYYGDKLYVVTSGGIGTADGNTIKLWSKNWGDL